MVVAQILPGRPLELQRPFDVAVIVVSIVREGLAHALRSVFEQRFDGTIQILLGIDKLVGDPAVLQRATEGAPANCVVTVVDLGYSTSTRHGGLHSSGYGGALRTILSYAANSRLLTYLDDDNWWGVDHLQTLHAAVADNDWAFAWRWYVDPDTQEPLCVDEWESVGPDAGTYRERFGGFVDPNCLMIDKLKCEPVLRWWSYPLNGNQQGLGDDRNVFHQLRLGYRWKCTGQASVYYTIQHSDGMDGQRRQWIRKKRASG